MSEERQWTLSRVVSYLFITFSGMTDQKITKEEREVIVQLVREWLPEEPIENLIENIKLVHDWVMEDVKIDNYMQNFAMLTSSLEEIFDEQRKKYFLNDLVRIAVADNNFTDSERSIIQGLAEAWELKNYKI